MPLSFGEWYLTENPSCNGIEHRRITGYDGIDHLFMVAYWELPARKDPSCGITEGVLRYEPPLSRERHEVVLDSDDVRYENYLRGLRGEPPIDGWEWSMELLSRDLRRARKAACEVSK